jgi:hypothetical protein
MTPRWRFVVVFLGFGLVVMSIGYYKAARERDGAQRDASSLEGAVSTGCMFLQGDLEAAVRGLELHAESDGGSEAAYLVYAIGRDGRLLPRHASTWHQQYMTCAANRAWSLDDASADLEKFGHLTVQTSGESGPALAATLRAMLDQVKATRGRRFARSTR